MAQHAHEAGLHVLDTAERVVFGAGTLTEVPISHAVAAVLNLSLRICSNPSSTWVTNSYAIVCNACAKEGASMDAARSAAQLPVNAHASEGQMLTLAPSLHFRLHTPPVGS